MSALKGDRDTHQQNTRRSQHHIHRAAHHGNTYPQKTAASISGSLPTGSNIALANNTRLTLYKTDAANSTMTISATCYGGSKAVISGTGLSVSPQQYADYKHDTRTIPLPLQPTPVPGRSPSGQLRQHQDGCPLPITMADGEIQDQRSGKQQCKHLFIS